MHSKVDELAEAVRSKTTILFVGAGVSMSVGLPSWSSLIDYLRSELGLPPDSSLHLSYQMLAEYYRLQKGSIGPLRSWMDREWTVRPDAIAKSEVHRLVVDLAFPIVYTTNYDSNLESAYRAYGASFKKITSVRDLTNLRAGDRQIVKYHGDFDDDESLVLTETDYLDRLTFDSPLDIKFRSDSLGHSLLFVGYSLSDPNIRLLLHRLWRMWRDSGREKDRPRLFFFAPEMDQVRDALLEQWGISTLSQVADTPAGSLLLFLRELKARVDGDGP